MKTTITITTIYATPEQIQQAQRDFNKIAKTLVTCNAKATTKTVHEYVCNNDSTDILELAKKAAYIAMRTMAIKSGDPTMQKLQLAIPHYPNCTDDAQDIVQQAAMLILEAQSDNMNNPFIEAVKGVHRYVYAQKRKKADAKKLWIDDPNTGDLECVNDSIYRLINGIYTNDVINNISAILSPTQRKVLKYMAYGYDYITIVKRLNISEKTLSVHIARIREKARNLYPNGIDTE